jgi:hypothetical protein
VEPGPKLGWMLNALLEDVLDNPSNNNELYLDEKTKELLTLAESELKALGDLGRKKRDEKEAEEVRKIMEKNHVE